MERADGGRVVHVQSQLALFFASSESARTSLVGSLMRMRTLDIAIRKHLKASEAVRAQIHEVGQAQNETAGTAVASSQRNAKRPRCEAAEAVVASSCDVRASLRQELKFHCDAAVALSLERRGAAQNSVHCAQDVYLMWRLRRANLQRSLQLHNSL